MSLSQTKIEEINGAVDLAMTELRGAVKNVPDKGLGLKPAHTRLATSVATLMVLLEEAHSHHGDEDLWGWVNY